MRIPQPSATAGATWTGAAPEREHTFVGVEQIEVSVTHELGTDLAGGIIERLRWIPPTDRLTVVKVISQVVTHGAKRLHSAEYLATVRRRKARSLAVAIAQLEKDADRADFVVRTYPIVKQIEALLSDLADATAEGNSREVLRQLRNSFMNGGWDRYRGDAAPGAAQKILDQLAALPEVSADLVEIAFHGLSDGGLQPVRAPLFTLEEEEEGADGQNQVPG